MIGQWRLWVAGQYALQSWLDDYNFKEQLGDKTDV